MQNNSVRNRAVAPAEGERRALRGYMDQYDKAGAAIYAELERGQLLWIGVADRSAGIADDLVLGFDGQVVGHQFKTAKFPGTFRIETLFTGADGLLKPLVKAWQSLRTANPGSRVEIRLVVNDYPSINDNPGDATPAHSAAFLNEFERFPDRSLQAWRASSWSRLINLLHQASGLDEDDFDRFMLALRVLHGAAADFVQFHKLGAEQARLASEIAQVLPNLVTDARDKDRWSREELLRELGWRDPAKTRHLHQFPVGAYVQRNLDTEVSLLQALRAVDQGYVALVGPPGSGKSTLLQMAMATEPHVRLVRYLAFMPGTAQGVGRGEADDFLEDVAAQMRNGGLLGLRLRDNSQHERREQFGAFLRQAGERYGRDGVRTIIVVDGLDHVPREERPTHSLLAELPLPAAVPTGVTFVLGTQRLDLEHLKPAVREQAAESGRLVEMRPLERDVVARMADWLDLDPTISRPRLYELSQGHPLATRYLIHALLNANEAERVHLLAGGMEFNGDIESVYASAWREIANDSEAMKVLGFIARAEAPMPLELLATIVAEHAIERALMTARHLLRETPHGWSVFHNSFRLFVLSKPRMRLGSVDHAYSQRVYRELAQLARGAPADSLHRWLELRYRARADDRDGVLALATPALFRQQLAQGRAVSEIESDIRLALLAVRSTHDATIVTRLLLCRDEVSRRTTALEYADQLPLAMLAVGDVDAAYAFVQDFPSRGYEVVDELLERGEFDRAKELFEHLEPLSQLHTSRFQHHGQDHNLREFEKWAGRVFHFRDFEQIRQAIDHVAAEGIKKTPGATTEETTDAMRKRLRRTVAKAFLSQQAGADVHDVCDQLGIEQIEHPSLMVHAGFAARNRGESAQGLTLFVAAMGLPGFDNVPNGWRRSIALLAMTAGRQEVAADLFDRLVAPAISMRDDDLHTANLGDLVSAVLEHAQLCTMLAMPLSTVAPSKHAILRPLQAHATEIGMLLGRAVTDASSIAASSVQMATRSAMGYVLRLSPSGGSDSYLTHQAVTAAPVLARSLLQIGSMCGEAEYRAVLQEIDNAISTSTLKGTMLLRREIAVGTYRTDGDRASAAARLEPMVGELVENTPSEQLDGLADLAIAFAAIGDIERARCLLATIPDHCLGYALAARKDPQYAMWRDVLVLANAADPAQRPLRISQLIRQVDGMKETEGADAAYRLTMTIIDEAMQVNARIGFDVAQALVDGHLIGWPNRIDALMIGMLRRRPELLFPGVTTWCGLCLPFYMEPYYRDPTHVGDFIAVAADAAGSSLIAELVPMLLSAIEVDSRAYERLTLLKRLHAAASRHGYSDRRLEDAIDRWSSDAPALRRSYTPQKYDDVATLDELQRAFEADGEKLDHNAPSRFSELAQFAPLEQVRQMYERWDCLQSDTRCRFMVVERLAKAGDTANARRLLHEYETSGDQWSSWSQWMGGGKFRYFQARKLLDGATMHSPAYESFVDSVAAGEENTLAVLTDIDSILPVISAAPDWPAIWSLLAEQMASTREYQLGTQFEARREPLNDEGLLAELLHFALRLPIADVQRHARNCAMQLADQSGSGGVVFELTMRRLLAGGSDEPLQALLTLLLLDHDRLAASFGQAVAELVNHRDLAVAEAAELLARRWGIPVSVDLQPLPLFYQMEMDGSLDYDDALLDKATGAMRVENAMGWTQMLRSIAQVLAAIAGSGELNIRQRAAMFIQEWGGMDAFGLPALKRLEAQLHALEMKITYFKPHAWIGVLALRHVAGEIRRAGLLSQRDIPPILEQLNAPLPPRPLIRAQVRPREIRRPLALKNVPWWEAENLWVAQVDDDVTPWSDRPDEQVLAEVSRFKIVEARRAEYRFHRIRAPQLRADGDSFWDWYKELPAAVWLGQFVPLDVEPAPTLVRRLVSSFGIDAPEHPIILCPHWLMKLRWREHDAEDFVYVDTDGVVVARIQYWRDAGPTDIDDDSVWGEGVYLALTKEGLKQLANVQEIPRIGAFAEREVMMQQEGDKHIAKSAQHIYAVSPSAN
ncbi:ATP-binding protein [Acidithiobacillus ferridurans]|uniref:AAA family ATPase n=1 Tax=Acidithiobacillus ferridurans TaxID=1232575 RepID=UPI001C07C509|nr:AAA family ATPase [Acidithiobacillus ferridurans]MBU2804258.1 ATP-binding protein [Acidithiobacillus ferridurans]